MRIFHVLRDLIANSKPVQELFSMLSIAVLNSTVQFSQRKIHEKEEEDRYVKDFNDIVIHWFVVGLVPLVGIIFCVSLHSLTFLYHP